MADNSHRSCRGPTFVNNQFVSRLFQKKGQIRFLEDNAKKKKIIILLMFDISKSFMIMSDYVVRNITAVVILKEEGFF